DMFIIIAYASHNFTLIDTIIVLKLIKTAPTAGLKTIPIGAKTPAANGMAKMLYPVAHHKFWTIFRYVFFDKSIKSTTSLGLLLTNTTSAAYLLHQYQHQLQSLNQQLQEQGHHLPHLLSSLLSILLIEFLLLYLLYHPVTLLHKLHRYSTVLLRSEPLLHCLLLA